MPVPAWNDNSDRTQKDVVELLENAARQADELTNRRAT